MVRCRVVAARIKAEDLLQEDLDVSAAADLIRSITSPATWDVLFVKRGRSALDYSKRLGELLLSLLRCPLSRFATSRPGLVMLPRHMACHDVPFSISRGMADDNTRETRNGAGPHTPGGFTPHPPR